MDKNKLLYFIKDRGYRVKDFLLAVELDKGKFYRRIQNNSFTVKEIWDIANILKLTAEDIDSIFFANYVSK